MDQFTHTKAAWPVYEIEYKRLHKLLMNIKDMESFQTWEAAMKVNLMKLQDAFYEDTKDYNGLHHCRLISAHWLYQFIIKQKDPNP